MQFAVSNVAIVELDSTSAAVQRNIAKKLHCVSGPLPYTRPHSPAVHFVTLF